MSGASLLPDREDLGQLARHAEGAGSSLQIRHGLRIDQSLVEQQRVHTRRNHRDEGSSRGRAISECQHQNAHQHILHRNHGSLAIRAEGELVAHAVRQGDEQTGSLQRIGNERHAGGGAGSDELQDLRHLHDGAGADDSNPQGLRDGQ